MQRGRDGDDGAARALARLADLLGEEAGWGSGSLLLMLDRPAGASADEVDVAVMPLDGSPADALAGFVAPSTALAIGVVAHGWARPMDARPGDGPVERVRVRVTTAVDRTGDVAGTLRWEDGRVLHDPPTEGRVLDRLRAALGSGPGRRRGRCRGGSGRGH